MQPELTSSLHMPDGAAENTPDAEAGRDQTGRLQTEQLYALLFAVVIEGEKRLFSLLERHGLTTPQFYVLKTLSEQGGQMGIGQIARAHSLTNATMTGLINRLEAMQPPPVARQTDSRDRRAVTVLLTDAGAARFEAVQRDVLEELHTLFSLLPAGERQRILDDVAHYVGLILRMGAGTGTPGDQSPG